VTLGELDVEDGTDDLDDPPDFLFRHFSSVPDYSFCAAAPDTISISSFVIRAWRARL
jgi:hypothetical protein